MHGGAHGRSERCLTILPSLKTAVRGKRGEEGGAERTRRRRNEQKAKKRCTAEEKEKSERNIRKIRKILNRCAHNRRDGERAGKNEEEEEGGNKISTKNGKFVRGGMRIKATGGGETIINSA